MSIGIDSAQFPSLPGYRVEGVLGQGGMGVVYRGVQEILQRPVAIKALAGEEFEGAIQTPERFLNEARILARMEPHENVTQVYDVTRDQNGRFHIVMEFALGHSLEERLALGQPPQQTEAAWIVSKAARGLHHAHKHNIIHRDVKPANIMITEKGGVKVMDFGIARAEGLANRTEAGLALGTPQYMSPEQVTQDRPLDARSDVYSLGVVLFYLACGQLPFDDPSPYRVGHMHARDPLPRPSGINPDLSPALERILLTALAKRPEDRFPTAEAFALALEEFLARRDATQTPSGLRFNPRGILASTSAGPITTAEPSLPASTGRSVYSSSHSDAPTTGLPSEQAALYPPGAPPHPAGPPSHFHQSPSDSYRSGGAPWPPAGTTPFPPTPGGAPLDSFYPAGPQSVPSGTAPQPLPLGVHPSDSYYRINAVPQPLPLGAPLLPGAHPSDYYRAGAIPQVLPPGAVPPPPPPGAHPSDYYRANPPNANWAQVPGGVLPPGIPPGMPWPPPAWPPQPTTQELAERRNRLIFKTLFYLLVLVGFVYLFWASARLLPKPNKPRLPVVRTPQVHDRNILR
jgi:serine/threonine protein kinase